MQVCDLTWGGVDVAVGAFACGSLPWGWSLHRLHSHSQKNTFWFVLHCTFEVWPVINLYYGCTSLLLLLTLREEGEIFIFNIKCSFRVSAFCSHIFISYIQNIYEKSIKDHGLINSLSETNTIVQAGFLHVYL